MHEAVNIAQTRILWLVFTSVCAFAERWLKSAEWHMEISLGNWSIDVDLCGWKRDGFCQPTIACFDWNPVSTKARYRWSNSHDLDSTSSLEIFLGRSINEINHVNFRLLRNLGKLKKH